MDSNRSPLDGFFNIFGNGLPQGHDKPVKHALYNAVAIFLLFLSCATGWALYVILEPFIKPLMWALLVGSVLHPIKRTLRDTFINWFDKLDQSETPIVIGLILLPVNIIDKTSELLGNILVKHVKLIASVSMLLLLVPILYFYTPSFIILIVWKLFWLFDITGNYILNLTSITCVSIGAILYLSSVYLLWTPENNDKFHYTSILLWSFICLSISNEFGTFGLPVFLILQLIILGGFFNEVYSIYIKKKDEGENLNLATVLQLALSGEELRESENDTSKESKEGNEEETPQKLPVKHRVKFQRSLSQPQFFRNEPKNFFPFGLNYYKKLNRNDEKHIESTFYLYVLIYACCGMILWKNMMLIPLILIPILLYILKYSGCYLGIWQYLNARFVIASSLVGNWCNVRQNALVPAPIRILYKTIQKFNVSVKVSMKNRVDTVSSCVVILALIVFLICASVFIVIQIYAEAIMLIQITSNVINQTVVHNPELSQLLPNTFDDTVDSILDNAYLYGREGISKTVKSLMADVDDVKSQRIEKQILELWDRIYQSWMSSDSNNGPIVTHDAVLSSWKNFVSDIKKSPDMFNLGQLMDFTKQNIGTLMSLLESLWTIVKGNVNLILSSVGAFLSIILSGGTAVMNFILNLVVFLTTLFYLLNSSGNLYKPVELMTNFSSSGSRFGHALEGAIHSVFAASFKMATFYGLWTWFIHNLFGVRIVYLPSAVAMILGAVPFLGTYWAGVPAILDLWLAQDRGFTALLFACFIFLPISVVDTTIYKEIKGGHPYLTGLAIAGGVFCLGVEGAIIGPILLCGLYVAIDLSTNMFKESPSSDAALNVRMRMFQKTM